MNDEKQQQVKAPEGRPLPRAKPIEEVVKERVRGAVAGELSRLEVVAAKAMTDNDMESYCRALEAMAAIKGRSETYCIQIEMAAKTAAMASVAMQRPAGGPDEGGLKNLSELINKARGGRGKPAELTEDQQAEAPKDDQKASE